MSLQDENEVTDLINHLKSSIETTYIKFTTIDAINSETCISITVLTKENLVSVLNELNLKRSDQRTPAKVLVIYLFKMKTGLSNTLICMNFQIDNQSRRWKIYKARS